MRGNFVPGVSDYIRRLNVRHCLIQFYTSWVAVKKILVPPTSSDSSPDLWSSKQPWPTNLKSRSPSILYAPGMPIS